MCDGHTPLLPVELQAVNQPASTNRRHFTGPAVTSPTARPPAQRTAYNGASHCALSDMANHDLIDHIAERVEHLLLRHEELQRTNALLLEQVQTLTQERDQLKSRLSAARARVDALIDRLPGATSSSESST